MSPFVTAVTRLLGIRHPILLAPMGAIAGGSLAAAVTRAGGLGVLGAGGVLVGTRFHATEESLAAPEAKRRIVAASGDATVRTRVFDVAREIDWPGPFTGRALENDFTRRWHGREAELGGRRDEVQRYSDAAQRGDFDTAVVWAGEGVDLVHEIVPPARVVHDLAAGAEEVLRALAPLGSRGEGTSND